MPQNNTNKKKKVSVWQKLRITTEIKKRLLSFLKNEKVAEDFINLCVQTHVYHNVWDAIVCGQTLRTCILLEANKTVFKDFVDWKKVAKTIKAENKKRLEENRKGGLVLNPRKKK